MGLSRVWSCVHEEEDHKTNCVESLNNTLDKQSLQRDTQLLKMKLNNFIDGTEPTSLASSLNGE